MKSMGNVFGECFRRFLIVSNLEFFFFFGRINLEFLIVSNLEFAIVGLLLLHLELSTCPLWVTVPSYLDVLARKAIIFAFYFALKQKVCVQIFYSLFSMISFCLFTFYFFVTMYPNCTIVDNILFVVFFESLCFLPLYTFK